MRSITALTLADAMEENARNHPGKAATICADVAHTFGELRDRVHQLAGALATLGVGPGDRVLWLGQNCHRVLECLLACSHLGASFCPANWRQSPDEMAFVIDDLRPAVIVWQHAEIGTTVASARAAADHHATWIRHDGPGDDEESPATDGTDGPTAAGPNDPFYEDLLVGAPPPPAAAGEPDAAVAVLYTAAFDGRPNGALLTNANFIAQSVMIAMLQDLGEDTVYLACGPLFHIATLFVLVPTFHFGGTTVFVARPDTEAICLAVERHRCTATFILPPTIVDVIAWNEGRGHDLSSLRTAFDLPGWRPMTSPDPSKWGARPAGYGQTEVMGLATFAAFGGRSGDFATGRPSPLVQLRLVDESEQEVEPGSVGEIAVRGITVGAGYWNRPELNAHRSRFGWWHTGDLGRRNGDGTVTFVGPKQRMIKSASENVYPVEVELCLESHPHIREAAIIGVPDERWGQTVRALVVADAGANLDAETVIAFARPRIAGYKRPRSVVFVDAIPRKAGSKDYDELDRVYGGGGYPGVAT